MARGSSQVWSGLVLVLVRSGGGTGREGRLKAAKRADECVAELRPDDDDAG